MKSKFPQSFSYKNCLMAALVLVSGAGLLASPVQAGEAKAIAATNGTYFFGEADQADQIGKGYVVFTQQNGKVVGAIYHPQSEYNCFSGTIANGELNIVSTELDNTATPMQVALDKLYSIGELSLVGKNTLSACQQEIASRDALRPTASNQIIRPSLIP